MALKALRLLVWFVFGLNYINVLAAVNHQQGMNQFINTMVEKHAFEKAPLTKLFKSVEIKQSILKAIARPAEAFPWHRYRKIFLTTDRVTRGVQFWQENRKVVGQVAKEYGVPEEIIIAIIGVETFYGRNVGKYRVIDGLSTLAFAYPKRSSYFLKELENFLILCRDEHKDPLEPMGSYAGAMGIPQFMPSSFLSYAKDFDGDARRDIWKNHADTFASVANYFKQHHWKTGDPVAIKANITGTKYQRFLTAGLKPDANMAQLSAVGVVAKETIPNNSKVKFLAFELENGNDFWLCLHNFYVITRYNHSPLYAMAVFQLSQQIKKQFQAKS